MVGVAASPMRASSNTEDAAVIVGFVDAAVSPMGASTVAVVIAGLVGAAAAVVD